MAYKVTVMKPSKIDYFNWWRNFCIKYQIENTEELNILLQKHNARQLPNTVDIEFDTEEDFLMFVLKFS